MRLYTFKTLRIVKRFFPKYLWEKPLGNQKTIYLTFDDGPTPDVTAKTLDILKEFNAKTTFFLKGENAALYPELVQRILEEGHAIGNHSYSHFRGRKSSTHDFVQDFQKAESILPPTKLFRPPYGSITKAQANEIVKRGYQIVLWDVLTGDFDANLKKSVSLEKTIKYTSDGSIVVFHDNVKASHTMLYVLSNSLTYWKLKGFVFERL